jgi:FecR protein
MGRIVRLAAIGALLLASEAHAQERAGVVTTLEGKVTVSRASLQAPAPLKFKDDIFAKDRIATGADSVARILLGGRAVVTVREHSVVTITETPGVSTIDVAAGRAAVAVAREKMRPGDLVEVRTPNAVAGIRGTVIVAEVFDAHRSAITVLKGVIDVTRLDGGRATIVTALQRVTVADQAPVSAPQKISLDDANRLRDEFRVAPPRTTPVAAAEAITQVEVDRTAKLLSGIGAAPALDRGDQAANDSDGKSSGPSGDRVDKSDKIDKSGRGGSDKGTPTAKPTVATAPTGATTPAVATTPVSSGGAASVAVAPASSTAPSPSAILQAVSGLTDGSGKGDRGKGKRDR